MPTVSGPTAIPKRRNHWRRVEQARQRIEKNAHRIAQSLVDRAIAGDAKTGKWLLEHTAAMDSEGNELRPVAVSMDRLAAASQAPQDSTPRIMIGVSLGADFARVNAQQTDRPALPAALVSLPVSPIE